MKEEIKAKCIEANPDGEFELWVCENCKEIFAEYVNGCPSCNKGKVTIKVRNIHLTDVLFAVRKHDSEKLLNEGIIPLPQKAMFGNICVHWNLKETFENQSAELYSLLHNLLTDNKK